MCSVGDAIEEARRDYTKEELLERVEKLSKEVDPSTFVQRMKDSLTKDPKYSVILDIKRFCSECEFIAEKGGFMKRLPSYYYYSD